MDPGELIQRVGELKPLPASSVRLCQLIARPHCDLQEVQELVAFDQALTLKLLRAANSAASGSSESIGSVGEAILRLGTARLLALVVGSGAKPFLQAPVASYGLGEGALWRHSVAAAAGAEVAPEFCRVEVPPEAFSTALLHDVGKLVMGRLLNPETLKLIRLAREVDGLDSLEAESRVLHFHHGELGGLLAEHWQLPPRVVLGIRHHHTPELGQDVICDLTYLADHIAKSIEAGLDGRSFDTRFSPDVAARLQISEQTLDAIWPAAIERYSRVRLHYNAL